jgi:asparagine synthetase B (glutamine-hydrolysing)
MLSTENITTMDGNGRSFAVKDEIFCLFEGALDNLGSLKQQYGLAKSANEVILVIEAYKALRDRAPYPPSHVVGHLSGNFAFIVFDKSTSTVFVASVSYHTHLMALLRKANSCG